MFQQLMIIGNFGADPEMRFTPTGVPVVNVNVAVNRNWTANDGTQQSKTVWFQVSFWQKNAENVSKYLKKGSKVMVLGEIEGAKPWTDRDGNMQASIQVRCFQVKFLDNRNAEGDGYGGDHSGNNSTSLPQLEDEDIPF